MIEIPFVGGSYQGRSVNLNAQRTINWYPIMDKHGGRSPIALMHTPGLADWCDLGSSVQIREMIVGGDYLYAVGGDTLYKIGTDGAETAIGGVLTTTTGPVYMNYDKTYILVVDPGIDGYTYDTSGAGNLTVIADADFPTPSSCTWQDGYHIVSVTDEATCYISAYNNPTSWDALDFSTAEVKPDNLVRSFSHEQNVWQFGKDTTEVWYNSAAVDYPFERIQGGVLPFGCIAPASVASVAGLISWLSDRKQVIQAHGFTPQIISDESMEYRIGQYTTVSDAKGYCYIQEGHIFYILTFPSANETWAYDSTTQLWHERKSYPVLNNGHQSRHRGYCYAFYNNKHLIGDYSNGKIYEMDMDTYTDNSEVIKRERFTQFTNANRGKIFFSKLELEFESGVGLNAGQGSTPYVILNWSDDGGHKYGNEHWRSIGKIGKNRNRTKWHRLGSAYDRTFHITMTDPVKAVVSRAWVDVDIEGGTLSGSSNNKS